MSLMNMTEALDQMTRQGLPAVHLMTTALMGKTAGHLKEDHDVEAFDIAAGSKEEREIAKKANAMLHVKAHR